MDPKIVSVIFVVLLYFQDVNCGVINQGTRDRRSADKYEDLKSKLSKLQDLLTEIDARKSSDVKGDESELKETRQENTKSAKATGKDESTAKESAMSAEKENLPSSKDQLTAEDIAILKQLKQSLEKAQGTKGVQSSIKKQSQTESEQISKGSRFYDSPLSDEELKAQRVDKLRQLAALALLGKQDLPLTDGDGRSHTYAEPKEGTFGKFRQEVLENIEDKLLNDIAVAMQNGFSLEELLQGLQKREQIKRGKQNESLAKRIESLLRQERV